MADTPSDPASGGATGGATVLSFSTGRPVTPEEAAIDRFLAGLDDASWFSSLGMPPTDDERHDAATYLGGLGLEALETAWIADLDEARRLTQDGGWSRAWWQAEERAIDALTGKLERALGKAAATEILNKVMSAASKVVMGPAAVATSRLGVADQGLNRAMAGAATQAVYGMALVVGTGTGTGTGTDPKDKPTETRTNPLAAKFRLFAAGHWPLVVLAGRFSVL